MQQFWIKSRAGTFFATETGVAFIETMVALALLGVIAVSFLSGLATTSKVTVIADKQNTAQSLARSQMEWVKKINYTYGTPEYPPAEIPGGQDYIGYSAVIVAEPLHNPDNGIQKITITIELHDEEVLKLEGYKVDR